MQEKYESRTIDPTAGAVEAPIPSPTPLSALMGAGLPPIGGLLAKLRGLFDPSSVNTNFGVPTTILSVGPPDTANGGGLCFFEGDCIGSSNSSTNELPESANGGRATEGERTVSSSDEMCEWEEETVDDRRSRLSLLEEVEVEGERLKRERMLGIGIGKGCGVCGWRR